REGGRVRPLALSSLAKLGAVARDHRRDDLFSFFGARGQLDQGPKRRVVHLDIVRILKVQVSGEAFDEDNIGDGGQRELEDDELVVPCGQGTSIVANAPEGDVGQVGQLQQPL